jgi:16S rRNA (guanine527-N7)-methyltransferase
MLRLSKFTLHTARRIILISKAYIFADMEIIRKYFPGLTKRQDERLSMLGGLYADWNEKINTISRKDIENLYERHILGSLALAKIISFKPGTHVIDVGTGGGFPGIPLAILFPEVNFTLIDSIGKKIKVVEAIAGSVGLKNVKAHQMRFEMIKEKNDFVVSRAVAKIPEFVSWSHGKIRQNSFNEIPNGILYLKGGNFDDELTQIRRHTRVYHLKNYFEEEFFETKKIVHIWEPAAKTAKRGNSRRRL